jgi:hypothetical protein
MPPVSTTQAPSAAPGLTVPQAATDVPGPATVAFVQAAAPPRFQISSTTAATALTSSQQPIPIVIPGSGYMTEIDLQYVFASGSSSVTGALAEDAPWSVAPLITLDDGGPQNVNIDGYALYLENCYGGVGVRDPAASADTQVFNPLGTASGSGNGNGSFWLKIPLAVNARNYWGLMGNQDRGTRYNFRDDIGSSGTSLWATPPNPTIPTIQINRVYGWLPVPGPIAADGRKQEQVPPGYGIIHYLTVIRSDSAPSPSSVVNHYIRNLSNAVRTFILIFRAGTAATPRATAESNMPTQLDFVVGTDVVWSETTAHRRYMMWNRFRIDVPGSKGILVYDCLRDFAAIAGYELGDHYLFMGNISEAQFRNTYPSGYTAGGSLQIVTDSLFIPPGVDIYGAAA